MKKKLIALALAGLALAGCNSNSNALTETDTGPSIKMAESSEVKATTGVPEGAIASVNGDAIYPVQGANLNVLIEQTLAVQEFHKLGLDDAAIKAELKKISDRIYAQAYFNHSLKNTEVPEKEIQETYEKLKETTDLSQYKLMFAKTDLEEDAMAMIEKINGGEVVEELRPVRTDEKTGEGVWVMPQQIPGMFSQMLPKLKKGATLEAPIPTNQGYFVLYLKDKKTEPFPELDDSLKGKIKQSLIQKKVGAHLQGLRDQAVILIK